MYYFSKFRIQYAWVSWWYALKFICFGGPNITSHTDIDIPKTDSGHFKNGGSI